MDDLLTFVLTVISIVVVAAAFGLLIAFPVMWCWNATMPYIFSLPAITWGKAWCLMFLANILLKSHSTQQGERK